MGESFSQWTWECLEDPPAGARTSGNREVRAELLSLLLLHGSDGRLIKWIF